MSSAKISTESHFTAAREVVAVEMHAQRDHAVQITSVTILDVGQGASAVGMLVPLQGASAATPSSSARLVTNTPRPRRPSARKSSYPKHARTPKLGPPSGVLLMINVVVVHAWQKTEFVATTKTMMDLLAPRITFAVAMSALQRKVSAAKIREVQMRHGFRLRKPLPQLHI